MATEACAKKRSTGRTEPNTGDAETSVHENWQNAVLDYIMLKQRLEPVHERSRIPEQLKAIVPHGHRTDKIRGRILSGAAAWEEYLRMLEHDDLSALPLNTGKDNVNLRLGAYCDGLCRIWGRHAALDSTDRLLRNIPN